MAFSRAIDKSKENAARRVIKQGQAYICGMCGARYTGEAQAESCLKSCIGRYMDQSAVQDKAEKTGTSYRCSYCKRVHGTMVQAKECARNCKDHIQKKLDAESRYKTTQTVEEKLRKLAAFTGGDPAVPPARPRTTAGNGAPGGSPASKKTAAARSSSGPRPDARQEPATARPARNHPEDAPQTPVHPAEGSKFDRDGELYRCHSCHQKYKKYQDAIACFDQHRGSSLTAGTAKKDGDEKFLRDGAKYVCKQCSSKWFSRQEVIQCYDGHKTVDTGKDSSLSGKAPAGRGSPASSNEPADAARTRRSSTRNDAEKFFRDGAKYVCRICNKKLFTKSEVIQCYDSHGSEDDGDAPAGAAPILTAEDMEAASGKAPKVKAGNNRDGEDKFFRDGAKYVCRKCNSKHFTRGEVIQCFDKH